MKSALPGSASSVSGRCGRERGTMSVTSFWLAHDLRRQVTQSSKSGRKAGRQFVKHNKRRDKLWFGGVLDVSAPCALQGWRDSVRFVQADAWC